MMNDPRLMPIAVTLTQHDIEIILSVLLKQTVLPGEVWLNTFAVLKQQRDAALAPAATEPEPTRLRAVPKKD